MDGDTGHIKMIRMFKTSIITQPNRINRSFVTPKISLKRCFTKLMIV